MKPVFMKPVFMKPVFMKPVFMKPMFVKPVSFKTSLNHPRDACCTLWDYTMDKIEVVREDVYEWILRIYVYWHRVISVFYYVFYTWNTVHFIKPYRNPVYKYAGSR